MEYSLDFLSSDWPGAGLDLEYVVVLRDGLAPGGRMADLAEVLTQELTITRWQVGLRSGDSSAGRDSDELLTVLRHDDFTNVLIWYSCDLSGFYVEISAPDQIATGGPSESFYTGARDSDAARVNCILRPIGRALQAAGPFCAYFGVEGSAESVISALAQHNQWQLEWNDATYIRESTTILATLDQFRMS